MQESSEYDPTFFHELLKFKRVKDDFGISSTVAETGLEDLKKRLQRSLVFYRLNHMLYKKYSSSQNYYYIKDINEILTDSRTSAAIEFKHMADFNSEGEHLNKFVDTANHDRKMRGLVDYYRYHREIPRVFAKSVYDLYFDHHDRKRKVEYVIITRNLKNSKLGEEGKKAAEEKQRKLKTKKFDPFLKDLVEYSFAQKYYHHKNEDGFEKSRSLCSVYDKLHQVVNSGKKMSSSSFLDISQTSSPNKPACIDGKDKEANNQIVSEMNTQKFNFLKRKTPAQTATMLVNQRPEGQQEKKEVQLLPQSALSSTRRQFRDVKDLVLDVEEVSTKKLNLNSVVPKEVEKRSDSLSLANRVKRTNSRSKEEYGTIERNRLAQRGTSNSLKQSRKSENDRKKVSMERREIQGLKRNFESKTYWKSLERSVAEEDGAGARPRSHSKKKKNPPATETLKKSVNFNFNWTKVNKMLTNPLLINKSTGPMKPMTHRESMEGQQSKVKGSKNYLDQKSKVLKGYHHKVQSMLLNQVSNELVKATQQDPKGHFKAHEPGVFSRKNSLKEKDMLALMNYRSANEQNQVPKPKFISHSKKSSVYNIANPTNHLQKKRSLKKRKHTKAISGFKYDSTLGHTFSGGLAASSEKETTLRSNIFDHKKASTQLSSRLYHASDSGHKHSKSEAESLLAFKLSRAKHMISKKLSSDWEEKIQK